MSKRRLLATVLIFVLTIVLVVGASYLVSLLLKNTNKSKSLADTVPVIAVTKNLDSGLR